MNLKFDSSELGQAIKVVKSISDAPVFLGSTPQTIDEFIAGCEHISNIHVSFTNGEINITDISLDEHPQDKFVPTMRTTDALDMRALKLAISKKQINLDEYAGRFEKAWDGANMKRSLMQDSTLTFTKFRIYADIFDLAYGIVIFDKEGAKDPVSKEGDAYIIFNETGEFRLSAKFLADFCYVGGSDSTV